MNRYDIGTSGGGDGERVMWTLLRDGCSGLIGEIGGGEGRVYHITLRFITSFDRRLDHRNNSGWWVVDEIFESMHAVVKVWFRCCVLKGHLYQKSGGFLELIIGQSARVSKIVVFSGGRRHTALSALSRSWQSSR